MSAALSLDEAAPAVANNGGPVQRLLFVGGGHRFWGMEQALLMLESVLVKRSVACTHVTGGWSDGKFAAALRSRGVASVPVKLGRIYWRHPLWTFDGMRQMPGAWKMLRGLVRKEKPDAVVHLDLRTFLSTYPMLAGLGVPHIYREAVMPGDTAVDRAAYRLLFAVCRRVVVNSAAVRDRFVALGYPMDRLVLVENGTDCDALRPDLPAQRAGPVRIGIVGQVMERKGHDILVEALGALVARGRNVQLVIVGERKGAFADTLKARIDHLGLASRVTWTGVIEDKPSIYRQFDILAVPSRSDAFPNVAIEAGAAGLPVVGSRAGGLESAVVDGETGLLVAPGAAGPLADALHRLVADAEMRAAMGAAARLRVERRYSADRMAADFVAAVEVALGRRACA